LKSFEIRELILKDAQESARVLEKSIGAMVPDIEKAAKCMASAIKRGGKVLACGNGGSAADAQHLAGELVGRFLMERAPYAAVALTNDTSVMTSLANDYGYDAIFERQVLALGSKKDVLLAISTSGNSGNVISAMKAAKKKEMKIIALTGCGGGKMKGTADILLNVDSKETPRIQETHGYIIHALCGIIEKLLNE